MMVVTCVCGKGDEMRATGYLGVSGDERLSITSLSRLSDLDVIVLSIYKLNQTNKHHSSATLLPADPRKLLNKMDIFMFTPLACSVTEQRKAESTKPSAWRGAHKCWVISLPYGSARVSLSWGRIVIDPWSGN